MKKISILGSTGSIGTQTLEVVDNNPGAFEVCALSAGRNIDLLEKQIRKYRPALATVWDERDAADLRTRVADLSVRVEAGMDGHLAKPYNVPQMMETLNRLIGQKHS